MTLNLVHVVVGARLDAGLSVSENYNLVGLSQGYNYLSQKDLKTGKSVLKKTFIDRAVGTIA